MSSMDHISRIRGFQIAIIPASNGSLIDLFQEQVPRGVRFNHRMMRFVVFVAAIGIAFTGLVTADENPRAGWAEENVRTVQKKLRESGLYFGEIDGAYSSELAAALGRYQIRNGLPITGQLDEETSKALGANPAVTTTANDRTKNSETWRRLRAGEQRTPNNAPVRHLLVSNRHKRLFRLCKTVRLRLIRRSSLIRRPLVHHQPEVRRRILAGNGCVIMSVPLCWPGWICMSARKAISLPIKSSITIRVS